MKKEFNFKGAKRGLRHDPKGVKVAKTVRIDADIFLWLREEAEKSGIPYQTLLNSKLRLSMNRQSDFLTEKEVRAIVREEMGKKVS